MPKINQTKEASGFSAATGSEMTDTDRLNILLATGKLYVSGVVGHCLHDRDDIDTAINNDKWISSQNTEITHGMERMKNE